MREAEVQEEPSDEAGDELAEHFEVERADARVEFPADEEIVDRVAGVAPLGEELLAALLRALTEGVEVEREGHGVRERHSRGEEREEVAVDPAEIEPPTVNAVCHDAEGDDEDAHPVELVGEPLAVGQRDALLLHARECEMQHDAPRHPPEEHRARLRAEQHGARGEGEGRDPGDGVVIQGDAVMRVARHHEAVTHRGKAEHDAQRPDGAAELVVRIGLLRLPACRHHEREVVVKFD